VKCAVFFPPKKFPEAIFVAENLKKILWSYLMDICAQEKNEKSTSVQGSGLFRME
jgi:hypothetical protein